MAGIIDLLEKSLRRNGVNKILTGHTKGSLTALHATVHINHLNSIVIPVIALVWVADLTKELKADSL